MIKVRPIANLEELNQVFEQAKSDGHALINPTHAVTSEDGGLRGALSFVPMVMVWMHTKEANAVDSTRTLNAIETHLGMAGNKVMCIPCLKESPFYSVMEKLGFFSAGEFTLFVKGL